METEEYVTAALLAGKSPEEIATERDLTTGDDEYGDSAVIVDTAWYADDGNAEIKTLADNGPEAAQEYVDGGNWGDVEKTIWITVYAYRYGLRLADDGETVERVIVDREANTVTLDPDVPACEGGHEHSWIAPHEAVGGIKENPGVQGHGGGVICRELCEHCGCGRTTDTWAQNPTNGEQGLTSIEYKEGAYTRCDEHGWSEGDCGECEAVA